MMQPTKRARMFGALFALVMIAAVIAVIFADKAHADHATNEHCSLMFTEPRSERADECRDRGWTIKSRMILDPTNKVRVLVGLKPCRYEDSNNCYWRSRCHGNKQGDSFVNLNGRIWFASFGNYQCRHA